MNAKQALRRVSIRLEDLEKVLARAQNDIKMYNDAIDHMIAGGSPCDYCEDQTECSLQAKADGKGCKLWWLKYNREEDAEHADNESQGLLQDGPTSRGEDSDISGQIEAF